VNALEFGPAREDELDSLVLIDRTSPVPWRREAFAAELSFEPSSLFVLRDAGGVVAFALARRLGPDLDIVNLAVDAKRRRAGAGTLLLRSLLDHARAGGAGTAFLEVREGNMEARKLYEGAGFRETQRRKSFYRNPVEDAILMRRDLGLEDG
jgi:ribosomal-protein-alanine N-acetyltransferase